MNHLAKYKRSVSFYKLDNDYSNEYVDMYKYLYSTFKDLEKFTHSSFRYSTFYGKTNSEILIEEDLQSGYEINAINFQLYYTFQRKFCNCISVKDATLIFHEYITSVLSMKGKQTIFRDFIYTNSNMKPMYINSDYSQNDICI